MASEFEILSQVLLSLKDDQNDTMNDIQALINNRNHEVGLIDSIKNRVRKLSEIHADMQEVESFLAQVTRMELEMAEMNKKNRNTK
jgi:hypothetical protein